MRFGIIIAVILFEIITTVAAGIYVNCKAKASGQGNSFAVGGRSLGTWAVGTTICLICLGSGHTTGTMEGAYSIGLSQVWHTMGNGIALSLAAVTTFIWARRLRITSLGDVLTTLYGRGLTVCVAAVNIAVGWGVCSCETQAMGVVINALTGWNLKTAVIAGTIIGFLYIIIGGMEQSAILNQFNIVLLYGGLGIALLYIVHGLGTGGLENVREYYVSAGQSDMLRFTGAPGFLLKVGLPTLLAPFFCNICGQQTMQVAASAKSENAVRRIAYFVGPMNCIIGGISATFAIIAKSLPQYAELDAKVISVRMLVDMLPNWLITLVLAAFLAALLSSFGGFVMGPATIIANDFIKAYFKPNMTTKEESRWIRVGVVIGTIICGILAQMLPPVIEMMTWLFAFMAPTFFLVVYGLWWKRSNIVGTGTFLIVWLIANIWTFTDLKYVIGMGNVDMLYIILVLSVVLPIIGNCIFKTKQGYFHSDEWKQSEEYRLYQKDKHEGRA
ncbi:hypothetical protein AGATL06_29940 [Agathobaculum sp. TL06]